MLTADQKAILLKNPTFRQQAGVDPKTSNTLSTGMDRESIKNNLMGIGAPKVKEDIVKEITPVEPEKKSIMDKVIGQGGAMDKLGEQLGVRVGKVIDETKENFNKIGQNYDEARAEGDKLALPKAFLSSSALVPKAIGSHLFELTKQFLPPELKRDINSFMETVISNPNVQKDVIEPIIAKAEENPDAARAAQDFLDILAVLPLGKVVSEAKAGFKIAAKDLFTGAKKVGDLAADAKKTVAPVVEGVSSRFANKAAQNAEKTAIKSLTPDTKNIPKKEYLDLVEKGKIKPSKAFSPAKYILDDDEVALAKKYSKILKGNDPIKDTKSVMDNLASKSENVKSLVEKSNAPIDKNKLTDNMLEEILKIADTDMNVKEKDIIKMIESYQKFLKEGDVKELFNKRNSFTTGKTYEGLITTQKKLDQAARRGIVKTLKESLPEEYAATIDEMSDMYALKDLLEYGVKGGKGKSNIQKWIRENPGKAKAAGLILGSGVASGLYGAVK